MTEDEHFQFGRTSIESIYRFTMMRKLFAQIDSEVKESEAIMHGFLKELGYE